MGMGRNHGDNNPPTNQKHFIFYPIVFKFQLKLWVTYIHICLQLILLKKIMNLKS